MKKRIYGALLVSCLVLAFTGCNNTVVQDKNVIKLKPLTDEQQQIVNLLSSANHEVLFFSYKTDELYKNIDVWLEIYKDGELIEPYTAGLNSVSDEAKPLSGEIAIVINQTPDFQWTFVISQDGSRLSTVSEPNSNYLNSGRGYGPMNSPQTIDDGKEIVLYTSVFSNGSAVFYDAQEYSNRPELLKQYPYIHIIKCKFTK